MIIGAAGAQAHDEKKYPDFGGQWKRPPGIGNQYDISRPQRLGQVPPLTKEYQLIWEEGLQDQNLGGQGTDPTFTCIPDGMPRAMNVIFPMQIIIEPEMTIILIEYLTMQRRIFTDGLAAMLAIRAGARHRPPQKQHGRREGRPCRKNVRWRKRAATTPP